MRDRAVTALVPCEVSDELRVLPDEVKAFVGLESSDRLPQARYHQVLASMQFFDSEEVKKSAPGVHGHDKILRNRCVCKARREQLGC